MDKHNQNAQNVIRMSEFHPQTGYAAIAQVEAYWEALRGTRALPKRSEIDPRGIEQSLENAFILERIAPGIARLRIAGSHLNDLMGMEVRGMPLTALFDAPFRRDLATLLEEVFQTPAIAALQLESAASGGRPALDARMILMPLKSDLGDVSRILGCLVAKGDLGLAPRRFCITGRKLRQIGVPPLAGDLPPQSQRLPSVRKEPSASGFAETQNSFSGKPAPASQTVNAATKSSAPPDRPAYLRLIRSDDQD